VPRQFKGILDWFSICVFLTVVGCSKFYEFYGSRRFFLEGLVCCWPEEESRHRCWGLLDILLEAEDLLPLNPSDFGRAV